MSLEANIIQAQSYELPDGGIEKRMRSQHNKIRQGGGRRRKNKARGTRRIVAMFGKPIAIEGAKEKREQWALVECITYGNTCGFFHPSASF